MPFQKIFNSQRKVRFISCLLVATCVVLPNIWAYLKTPENYFFSGINLNVNSNDIQGVYFPAIRDFSQGDILYRNPFDSMVSPFFLYPVYLVLGKIVTLTSLPVRFVYHLSTFLFTFIFLLFVFRFLAIFFADFRKQLFAFGLICFGGLFLTGIVEGIGLFSFFLPHFTVAQLALLLCLYYLFKISFGKYLRFSYLALFISMLVLSAVHPWMSIVLIFFSFVWCMVFSLINKRISYKCTVAFFILLFGALPLLFYYIVKIHWISFPLSTPFYFPLMLYGTLFPLAIFGLYRSIKGPKNSHILYLAVWFVVQLVFIYLPLPFSRRFVEGMYVPLAVFSVVAVDWLIMRFNFKRWEVLIYANAFIYLSIGVIANYILLFVWLPNRYVYRSDEEKRAYLYLDENSKPNESILSLPESGNFMAGYTHLNIFIGHWIQTPDFFNKLSFVESYYEGKLEFESRKQMLLDNDICFVYAGPGENKILKLDLQKEDYLTGFYNSNGVKIYITSWCNYSTVTMNRVA